MAVNVLVIGGSTRPESLAEHAARIAGAGAEASGAQVAYVLSRDLILPIYDTEVPDRSPEAQHLVEAMRACDGVIVVSPGYHGGISGMIKNALDYAEDLRQDPRPYLDGRAFGAVAVAHGSQAGGSTLQQLRQVAHALRAWPTPLGGCIEASTTRLVGDDVNQGEVERLAFIGRQVVDFAMAYRLMSPSG